MITNIQIYYTDDCTLEGCIQKMKNFLNKKSRELAVE